MIMHSYQHLNEAWPEYPPTRDEIEPDPHPLPPTPEQSQMIHEAFGDPQLRRRHGW